MLLFLVKVNPVYRSGRQSQDRNRTGRGQTVDIRIYGIVRAGPTEQVVAFKKLYDKIQGYNNYQGKKSDLQLTGELAGFHYDLVNRDQLTVFHGNDKGIRKMTGSQSVAMLLGFLKAVEITQSIFILVNLPRAQDILYLRIGAEDTF